MRRLLSTLVTTAVLLMLGQATAFAQSSGQGAYGEIDDKIITNFGFIVIFAIPLFLLIMTLIQSGLDRRKERRKAAAKAAEADGRFDQGY